MEVSKRSVKEIFGTEQHIIVPLYQRPYVWTKDQQWEPLWNDIRKLAEQLLAEREPRPHFLGAIVLDQLKTRTGSMTRRVIIDGQQRLTTIQLFLEAFADLASKADDKYRRSLLKLTRNDDALSSDGEERFKVWPSNVDRQQYELVMDCSCPEDMISKHGAEVAAKSIGGAYVYFYRTLDEWLRIEDDGAEERVESLLAAAKDLLLFVVIDLAADEDAQLIFETLNARGTPLLQSDLVKNAVFYAAHLECEKIDDLYNSYWLHFETGADYWRANMTRGRVSYPRIELYLQHLLALLTLDDVKFDQLYKTFGGYAATSGLRSRKQLELISRYSHTYRGFDDATPDTRQRLFFDRLKTMEVTTVYPLLLEVCPVSSGQWEPVIPMLEDLESFLVRRMICRLTTQNYNKLFIELVKTIRGGNGSCDPEEAAHKVRGALLSYDGDSTRWPRDEEFKRAWADKPTYYWITAARVRMLLEAVEGQLRTDLSEKITIAEKLTVEHLMPQKWQKNYPLPDDEPTELATSQRDNVIHTLGNLTLVTKSFNPSVSNDPWNTKWEALKKQSALALNRDLQRYPVWTEEQIRDRGSWMADMAARVWPIAQ